MKITPTLLLLTILGGSAIGQPHQNNNDIKKLDWLVGTWQRTNNKPGQSGHERWEVVKPGELQGYGVTFIGQDTAFVEKIHILSRGNTLYYVADVPENREAVYFKLTEITATGFVCEKPTHDFPKKIAYERNKDSLKATISGDGKAVDYFFKRQ